MRRTLLIIFSIFCFYTTYTGIRELINIDSNIPGEHIKTVRRLFLIITIIAFLLGVLSFWLQLRIKKKEIQRITEQPSDIALTQLGNDYIEYSYKLDDLSIKVYGILGRVIITTIIVCLFGAFDLLAILAIYLLISYGSFFVKLTGNYIIGAVVTAIFLYVAFEKIDKAEPMMQIVLGVLLLFGIIIKDTVNILRLISLKSKIRQNGIITKKLTKEERKQYINRSSIIEN